MEKRGLAHDVEVRAVKRMGSRAKTLSTYSSANLVGLCKKYDKKQKREI